MMEATGMGKAAQRSLQEAIDVKRGVNSLFRSLRSPLLICQGKCQSLTQAMLSFAIAFTLPGALKDNGPWAGRAVTL